MNKTLKTLLAVGVAGFAMTTQADPQGNHRGNISPTKHAQHAAVDLGMGAAEHAAHGIIERGLNWLFGTEPAPTVVVEQPTPPVVVVEKPADVILVRDVGVPGHPPCVWGPRRPRRAPLKRMGGPGKPGPAPKPEPQGPVRGPDGRGREF